jgi:nitrite reductase/ring-hydroxylating ferredoxin subunit
MRFIVGPTSSIPDGTVRVVHPTPGPGIGVFNVGGEFFALRNGCPHMNGPLCAGTITGTSTAHSRADGVAQVGWERDGEIIACPWHRWEFEIRTGRTVFPSRRRARTYPVRVEEELVILELGESTGRRAA